MMVCLLAGRSRSFLRPATACDVSFATDNRLDTAALHGVVKRDRAKHVAVIRHGTGGHAELFGSLGQWFYLYCAVEKTVVSVEMEVCKSSVLHDDKKGGLRG